MHRSAPLAQRLAVDFDTEFDNPRAVRLRLPGRTVDSLTAIDGATNTQTIDYIKQVAAAILDVLDSPGA
ncbi:hypothetical protein [Actinoplanes sp. HUAS TT8]|uniref:hypothetical protein n=1 Tax=Actinoplanes sp. HUAS TT8 TaxID=3447453 RepID=UPI003F5224A7